MKMRLSKERYYLNIAKEIGERSTCLRRKFGAILVSTENVIVGTGYNGSARGVINCVDNGTCLKDAHNAEHYSNYDWCPAVHAEENAIINSDRAQRIGATLYIVGVDAKTGKLTFSWPCKRCKRKLINSMIERVVTLDTENNIISYKVSDWAEEDTKWYKENL